MALVRVTPPSTEPISTADAKLQAIVQVSSDDALIDAYIQAARESVEAFVRRSLITQTWRLSMDRWPWVIYLPQPPVTTVNSIKYVDDQGNLQTLASDNYRVDLDSQPARITPAYGYTWPSIQPVINAIQVEYEAGYGAASDVPEIFKQAMRLHVAEMYEFREQVIAGTIVAELPTGIKNLLWPHVAWGP